MTTYPTPAHTDECAAQIRGAVDRLYRRASNVLGAQVEATPEYTADYLTQCLRERDPDAPESMAQLAAVQIVHDVLDKSTSEVSAFWGTALGRAIVWHVGWPGTHEIKIVPASVVMFVLGVTRQRAHQLGPLYSDDLRGRLREQWSEIQTRKSRNHLALVK